MEVSVLCVSPLHHRRLALSTLPTPLPPALFVGAAFVWMFVADLKACYCLSADAHTPLLAEFCGCREKPGGSQREEDVCARGRDLEGVWIDHVHYGEMSV